MLDSLRPRRRTAPLGALLLLLLSPPVARAAEQEHDPALMVLLNAFHRDPTPEALQRVGEDLVASLIAVATDPKAPRLARVRAVGALGYFDEDRAFETVRRIALDPAAPLRLRSAAVWTMGHRFSGRSGRTAVLARLLVAQEPLLRAAAVRSLDAIGSPEAARLLAARRQVERHRAVRRALRASLGRRQPLPREGRLASPPTPPATREDRR